MESSREFDCNCLDHLFTTRKSKKVLRAVTITIGYIQLVLYICTTAKFAYGLITVDNENSLEADFDTRDYDYASEEGVYMLNEWTQWIYLLFSIIGLASVWNMISGIKSKSPDIILPWFMFHLIYIYFNIAFKFIFNVIGSESPWTQSLYIVLENAMYGFLILLVYLQYRKLKGNNLRYEKRYGDDWCEA